MISGILWIYGAGFFIAIPRFFRSWMKNEYEDCGRVDSEDVYSVAFFSVALSVFWLPVLIFTFVNHEFIEPWLKSLDEREGE